MIILYIIYNSNTCLLGLLRHIYAAVITSRSLSRFRVFRRSFVPAHCNIILLLFTPYNFIISQQSIRLDFIVDVAHRNTSNITMINYRTSLSYSIVDSRYCILLQIRPLRRLIPFFTLLNIFHSFVSIHGRIIFLNDTSALLKISRYFYLFFVTNTHLHTTQRIIIMIYRYLQKFGTQSCSSIPVQLVIKLNKYFSEKYKNAY